MLRRWFQQRLYTLQQHFRLWVKFVKTPFAHERLGLVAKTKALRFGQTARQMLNTFTVCMDAIVPSHQFLQPHTCEKFAASILFFCAKFKIVVYMSL